MANAVDKAVRAQGGFVVKPYQVKAMILAARRAYERMRNEEGGRREELKYEVEERNCSSCAALSEAEGRKTENSAIPNSSFNIPHSFDEWRRAALHDVVGAAAPSSFRAVTQRDYAAVMDYFLSLAGEEKVKVKGEGEQWNSSSCASLRRASGTLAPTKAAGRKTANTAVHLSPSPSPSSVAQSSDERRRALWALNLVEGEVAERFGGRGGARSYADALFWRIHKTDRYTANARQVWAVIFTLRKRSSKIRAKTALGARGAAGVH